MKEFQGPRYYYVGSVQCLNYAEACAHAANLSDHVNAVLGANVTRDPSIKDGEEIQGETTVARFVKGKMVFPSWSRRA